MRSLTEMFQLVLHLNRNHPSICRTWHGSFSRHTRRTLRECRPSLLRDPHHSKYTRHIHMCLQRQGESMVKLLKVKLDSHLELTIILTGVTLKLTCLSNSSEELRNLKL